MKYYTVKFPLEMTSDKGSGYENLTELKDVISFNLKSVLLTCPGERISEPTFGVCLRNRLFEYPSPALIDSIRSDINSQVSLYIPSMTLLNVDIETEPNKNMIKIRIFYRINSLQETEEFELDFDLNI